jgi:hypothetical protein
MATRASRTRGADLVDNTPRQVLARRVLGPEPLLHTPLVLGANGEPSANGGSR